MFKKRWPWIVGGVLAVLAVGAWFAYDAMTGPMYHPGEVRSALGLREPLTPPPQDGDVQHWRVARDIELYHFEQGSGDDVLTVSGGPGFVHLEPWKAGAELGAHFRLHYYHQRGCGHSTRPIDKLDGKDFYHSLLKLNSTLGLGAQIADIERIRRILGRDRLILAGHSFGALFAALYAVEFPEHVRALVFISPANMAKLPNRDADLFAYLRSRLPAEKLPAYDQFLKEYFDFSGGMQKSDAELAASYRRFGEFYAAASPGFDLPAGEQAAMQLNGGMMPLAIFFSMGSRHDFRDALRKVQAPVLTITGANDLTPRAWCEAFNNLFPNHTFVELQGAGHFSFDDRPAEFAAAFEKFIAQH